MDLPNRLQQALATVRQPTFFEIKSAIQNAECTLACAEPYLETLTPPLSYGRKVICRSDTFEAILVFLPEKAETPVHDHGDSVCCVLVLAGTVTDRIYGPDALDEALPVPVREETCRPRDFLYTSRGQIHSMYNSGEGPAVTLHVYTPPLGNTRTAANPSDR